MSESTPAGAVPGEAPERGNPGRRSDAPQVSVVIPSYNSARHVARCLTALRAQSTKRPFEVILVDSSDDGADQIVAEGFPEVILFHFQGRRSVGAARNIGVEKASGDFILFVDTDCVPGPNWIDQLCAAIRDFGVDGVGGTVSNGTPWSIGGCVGYYLEFFRFLAYEGEPRATPYLLGGNCGFRREVFQTARYSDQSVGDDFTFNWQLLNRGRELLFFPAITVRHVNRTKLARVLSYQYKLGKGACAYRRHLSPRIMRVLERIPVLVVFMPAGVMAWIGGTVLRRRGFLEFLKFGALLPFALVANCLWAAGFFRELLNRKHGANERVPGEFRSTGRTGSSESLE